MFKFLKEKLSQATSIFSKKVEEDSEIKVETLTEDNIEENKHSDNSNPDVKSNSERINVDDNESEINMEKISSEKLIEEPNLDKKNIDLENEFELHEEEHTQKIDEDEEIRKRLEEQKRIEEAMLQEEIERNKLDEKRRQEEEDFKRRKLEYEQQELKAKEEASKKELEKKVLEQKKIDEEKKRKKGFFQKIFGKKDTEWDKVKPAGIVLEKEEFEKVKEDYSFSEDKQESKIDSLKNIQLEKNKEQINQDFENAIIKQDESEKKGFFEKIKESVTTVKISDEKFNDLFWDLELGLLENNVAVEVIEKIKKDLRVDLTSGKVSRSSVEEIVQYSLKKSFESLFSEAKSFDLIERIKSSKKPFVIAFIGVNGSGKTTTMAKIANLIKQNGLSLVFAAGDTFRAAAMQQLQEHADKLEIKMIKHDYESDPAAVAFDAIKHAEAKGLDVVLIDTAGRLHTNDNLMNELKKLIRVNKPDLKIFIGESITGNDCVEQAKLFDEAVGIDAIILAKADVDEKGGAAISVSYVTKKPILYLGTGQTYSDLTKFNSENIIKNIGL